MKRLPFLAAVFLTLALAASADDRDVLLFPNGDRVSGELIGEEEGLYHFRADSVGSITVATDAATLVRASREEEEEEEVVIAQEPEEPAVVEPPVEAAASAIPLRRPPWKGRIDFGYTWQSGRAEKNEVSLRAQADQKIEESEYRAMAEFLYGQVGGVRNTHRYLGSFRWRETISERVFGQSFTRYDSDRIREIRNRVEQTVGVGYRFLKSDQLEASMVPGFTVQYTDRYGDDERWSYLGNLFQDLVWRMTPQYRFEQDANFLIDPNDTDDFQVRFNAGIVGTMRQNINLSLRYQYLFENESPPGVERYDQRLITSIGYAF